VELYDLTGRQVFKINQALEKGVSGEFIVDASDLVKGVYLMKLRLGDELVIRRVVKL
jgi:hypothetical protein